MPHVPYDTTAFQLLHEGSYALGVVQRNGMRIDEAYLHRAQEAIEKKIKKQVSLLKDTDIWRTWSRIYGDDSNFDSGPQLGRILYDELGIECKKFTEKGGRSTDEEALTAINSPFTRRLLHVRKLQKAKNTYIHNLLLESFGGYIHPSFSLNKVVTYRSSCSGPNIQNMPIRQPMMGKLIRRAFICRYRGGMIVEIDFSGAEVRVATCYHKDPTMVEYILNDYDMHSAMAKECFKIVGDVPKALRQEVKGKFVFAAFYGDWWKQIAENLWGIIDDHDIDGVRLRHHLRNKGIRNLTKFTKHIRKVYDHFWNVRFPVYTQWKQDTWNFYLQNGWVQMLTGFVVQHTATRNEIINAPIQGSSFHCLLWTLIQLVKRLKKYKMKTVVTGQVHDSVICEVYPGELPALFDIVKTIVFEDLPKHWPWLIVPMETEAEGSETNWHEKQELAL